MPSLDLSVVIPAYRSAGTLEELVGRLLRVLEARGGASCHNGYKSCFYRKVAAAADVADSASLKLEFAARPVFDPAKVYKR